MSLWRHLTRGLRVLTARAASDQDLGEEAQHYLDQTTEEFIARGLSPEEARRSARLECGTLVVRGPGDAAALAMALRQAIWSIDKDQPIVRVITMDDLLARSSAERRFVMIVLTVFAIVALALAAAGIYGILSGGVAERIREIGVRLALGASPGQILLLIVRQGIVLTLCGTAIGLIGSVAGSKAVATLLFGVSPLDFATYFGMLALLLAVAAAACWVPAWRASRIDPAITLRAE